MAVGAARNLVALARMAPTSAAPWADLFAALREEIAVDRICLLLRLDRSTGVVIRLAQTPGMAAALAGESLYEDRPDSKAFAIIAAGEPALVGPEEWFRYPDLRAIWPTLRSNMKLPIRLGAWPAVWSVWSAEPDRYTAADLDRLRPIAAAMRRAPFQFDPGPVRLAIRQMLALEGHRRPCMRAGAAG